MKHNPIPNLFPRYIPEHRQRVLAYYREWMLTDEHGVRYPCYGPDDIIAIIFTENLLTFVHSMQDIPTGIFDAALAHGEIYCNKEGQPISLKIRGPRNETRWFVCSGAWDVAFPSLAFLQELREVFTMANVGVANTPGTLGILLLKHSFLLEWGPCGWREHRHRRPPESVCEDLRASCFGARSEILEQGEYHELFELDRKNGYGAALAEEQPTGPAFRIGADHQWSTGFAAYVVRCRVTLDTAFIYGLFPLRGEDGTIHYPTRPGTYITTLWSDELAELRLRSGITVEILEGHGWKQTTDECKYFVRTVERLRDQAGELAGYFKQALVKCIGRLGMSPVSYTLTTEPTETPAAWCGQASDLFVQEKRDPHPETMPHWMYSVIMKCRVALQKEAEQWKKQEMLVATNTDAVYLAPMADVSSYPQRMLKNTLPSGAWSYQSLTQKETGEKMIPANRHLVSQEKIRRPGVKRGEF